MTKARDIASAAPAPSTVSATELGYLDGVTSAIQTQIDGKQAANANVSTTELGYLDGVTSAIQTQIDGKSSTSHNHDSTYIAKTLTTTTGDMIYASSANTPARLGIGSSGQVLTVSGGIPSWATAASGSQIVQIVQSTYTTETNSSSSTYADTGLTATITPTSSSNKILVLLTHSACRKANSTNDTFMAMKLVRSGTDIAQVTDYAGASTDHKELYFGNISYSYLDSPATTSSRTYKTQFASVNNLASVGVQINGSRSTIQLIEISGV